MQLFPAPLLQSCTPKPIESELSTPDKLSCRNNYCTKQVHGFLNRSEVQDSSYTKKKTCICFLTQEMFSFKWFRETATCLLWRLWHHDSGPPPLSHDWSSRGNIQIQAWLIGPEPVCTVQGTHVHSDITLCGTHSLMACRDEIQAAARKTQSLKLSFTIMLNMWRKYN